MLPSDLPPEHLAGYLGQDFFHHSTPSSTLDSVADRLPELLARNPDAGREVILAYAWAVAEAGKPVQGIVQKYSEVLRADDSSWARAGAALVAAGHSALGAAWLADYRDREDLEAWMLGPLTVAYRSLDQDDKAIEVCRAVVKLGGPDEVLGDFRAWLALDLALSGQAEEASAQAVRVDAVTAADRREDAMNCVAIVAPDLLFLSPTATEYRETDRRNRYNG